MKRTIIATQGHGEFVSLTLDNRERRTYNTNKEQDRIALAGVMRGCGKPVVLWLDELVGCSFEDYDNG